ncbi:MAG: DUF2341 domain-containing protein, partial [Bacteroidota bacterium]
NADKEIYMYYGNPAVSASTEDVTNLWSEDYLGVFHLNDDGTDAIGTATSPVEQSMTYVDGIIGRVGDFEASNPSKINTATDYAGQIPSQLTLSAWAIMETTGTDRTLLGQFNNTPTNTGLLLWMDNGTDGFAFGVGETDDIAKVGETNLVTNLETQWHHVVGTWDGSQISLYIDGVFIESASHDGNFTHDSPVFSLGTEKGNSDNRPMDGRLDEARILRTARDANWILTEYNNQRDGSTFMTLGIEEDVCDIALVGTITAAQNDLTPGTGTTLSLDGYGAGLTLQWQSSIDGTAFADVTGGSGGTTDRYTTENLTTSTYYRVELNNGGCDAYSASLLLNVRPPFIDGYSHRVGITVPADKVDGSGDLADFPLLVSITDDSLRSATNGGNVYSDQGYDLKFADASGADLDHELEEYDPVLGIVRAWVRIPTLSGSEDNELYLYYGNCTASADGSTSSTWNAGYELVMHMDDVTDSKPLPYTLTDNGTAAATGQIGSGREFVRSQSDNISFPIDTDLLRNVEVATFSSWINLDDLTNRQTLVAVSKGNGSDTNLSRGAVEFSDDNGGRIKVGGRQRDTGGIYESSREQTAGMTSTDDWYYWTAVIDYNGKSIEFYLDGSQVTLDAQTGAIDWPNTRTDNTPARNAAIGSEDDGSNSKYFDGIMDEVRISHVRRSANWIKTEYDNQVDPSAFLTITAQETEYQWTGAGGTSWNTSGSWSSCQVPNASVAARIPDVSNDPVLLSDVKLTNLTVESGALVSLGSSCVELTGDFENSGNILASNGTIKFTGDADQSYTGSSLTVESIIVDKSAGTVSLFEDVLVEGSFALSNGSVALEGGELTVESGAIAGAGPDAYIMTPSSSCLKMFVPSTDVFFPVGSIAGYSPAILNNSGVADTFCIRVIDNL